MNQHELDIIMEVAISRTCDLLTDRELNALYLVSLLETNPKQVQGYEKVATLFTEADGTRMHNETKSAFARIWHQRCGRG